MKPTVNFANDNSVMILRNGNEECYCNFLDHGLFFVVTY